MVIKKNMQNQSKFVGNSQSFAPPPLLPLLCVAIFIILESQAKSYGIKTTSYADKTTSYADKTTSYAHKTASYANKTVQVTLTKLQVTPTKLQVTSSKLTSLTAETNKFQLTNMLFITF